MEKRGRKLKLIKRLRIPKSHEEEFLYSLGFKNVVGMDEVGRGAWAGPLVSAAVVMPKRLYKIRDSKLLTREERLRLSYKIKRTCKFGFGRVEVWEFNKLGLSKSLLLSYERALRALRRKVDFLLVDGNQKFHSPPPKNSKKQRGEASSPASPIGGPTLAKLFRQGSLAYRSIVKGDMKCSSIAAASIVAKVERDRIMNKMSKIYPGFYFEKNKGYGTKLHRRQLAKRGVCKIHRINYAPIKKALSCR